MLNSHQQEKVIAAFREGNLRVRSVSPEGVVQWKPIFRAFKAENLDHETIWRVTTELGSSVVTGGHRVYVSPEDCVDAENLRPGMQVLCVRDEKPVCLSISKIERIETRSTMYDLEVEGNHNLVLHNSSIVGHNSPDRNYSFRPPLQEGVVDKFNRVFGQLWQDYELKVYLESALEMWNAMPPETEGIFDLDQLCAQKPTWRAYVIWGAMQYALLALSVNMVADEFSIAGEQQVRIYLPGGETVDLGIEDLYDILNE